MLQHNQEFEQVIDFKGSWSVFECDYRFGILYVAQPTVCGEGDGWVAICSGLSSEAALALRNQKRAEHYGTELAGAL